MPQWKQFTLVIAAALKPIEPIAPHDRFVITMRLQTVGSIAFTILAVMLVVVLH